MFLALSLGMTLSEVRERISAAELSAWFAYYRLEPWGEERADLRSAIVASNVANSNRDPRKRPEPYAPADFMPFGKRNDDKPDAVIGRIKRGFKQLKEQR
jgi:hypothetical protein